MAQRLTPIAQQTLNMQVVGAAGDAAPAATCPCESGAEGPDGAEDLGSTLVATASAHWIALWTVSIMYPVFGIFTGLLGCL